MSLIIHIIQFSCTYTEETGQYLAGIEMSVDLNDDLVVFIRCLFPGDHDLGCRQILQLVDLQTPVVLFFRKIR